MICLLSVYPPFKSFCQLQGLLLQSDKYLGVCLELTCYLLDYRNRIINVECFHSFVVKEAYLVHQGNNLSKSVYVRFSRSFLMTLKASPKSSVRIKLLFLLAPDLRYSSRIFCWSSSLGILMCHLSHLSHRGQVVHLPSGLFCFIFYLASLSQLWSDWTPCWGKGLCGTNGNLWDKDTPCQYQEGMLHRLYRSLYFFSAQVNLSSRHRDLEKLINRDLDIGLGWLRCWGTEFVDEVLACQVNPSHHKPSSELALCRKLYSNGTKAI